MRISREAQLTFSSLLPKRKQSTLTTLLRRSEVKSYFLYGYGRIALLDGLKLLGCEEGSNVLLPAYICSIAVEPLNELAIEARFYDVSLRLEPDITDIVHRIDRRTKGILVVDYFGFPAALREIQSLCRQHGIYLIEDAAHGFLSKSDSHLLGTFGDIGFSSFWKVLPVPNGAVLFTVNQEVIRAAENMETLPAAHNQLPKMNRRSICSYVLNSLLSNFESQLGLQATWARGFYRKLFPANHIDSTNYWFQRSKVRISDLSMRIADNTDLEEVCRRRRENYKFWLSEMGGRQHVHTVFADLPDGVCPLYFVIVVDDAAIFIEQMLNRGIPAFNWPSLLPKEIKNNPEYSNANYLAQHLVTLPVHQNLKQDDLKRALRR